MSLIKMCDIPECKREVSKPQLGYGILPLAGGYEIRVFVARPKLSGEAYSQIIDVCNEHLKEYMMEVTKNDR